MYTHCVDITLTLVSSDRTYFRCWWKRLRCVFTKNDELYILSAGLGYYSLKTFSALAISAEGHISAECMKKSLVCCDTRAIPHQIQKFATHFLWCTTSHLYCVRSQDSLFVCMCVSTQRAVFLHILCCYGTAHLLATTETVFSVYGCAVKGHAIGDT